MDESKGPPLEGEGVLGCVVKSSHGDVKQASLEDSPQVQKEMKYSFDFCFAFFPPQAASFPSILPITRFINVILKIVCIMYDRDLCGWPDFGSASKSDKARPRLDPEDWIGSTDVSDCPLNDKLLMSSL